MAEKPDPQGPPLGGRVNPSAVIGHYGLLCLSAGRSVIALPLRAGTSSRAGAEWEHASMVLRRFVRSPPVWSIPRRSLSTGARLTDPHVRGEYSARELAEAWDWDRPPHAWGRLPIRGLQPVQGRPTPTCV